MGDIARRVLHGPSGPGRAPLPSPSLTPLPSTRPHLSLREQGRGGPGPGRAQALRWKVRELPEPPPRSARTLPEPCPNRARTHRAPPSGSEPCPNPIGQAISRQRNPFLPDVADVFYTPLPAPRTTCQGHAASGTRARNSDLPPPAPLHSSRTPPVALSWPPQPPTLPRPPTEPPKLHRFPHPAASIQLSPRTLPPRPTPLRSPDPAPHARAPAVCRSAPPTPTRREDPFAKRMGGPAAPVLWVAGEPLPPHAPFPSPSSLQAWGGRGGGGRAGFGGEGPLRRGPRTWGEHSLQVSRPFVARDDPSPGDGCLALSAARCPRG